MGDTKTPVEHVVGTSMDTPVEKPDGGLNRAFRVDTSGLRHHH